MILHSGGASCDRHNTGIILWLQVQVILPFHKVHHWQALLGTSNLSGRWLRKLQPSYTAAASTYPSECAGKGETRMGPVLLSRMLFNCRTGTMSFKQISPPGHGVMNRRAEDVNIYTYTIVSNSNLENE
jgi:hypothetical protein